MISKIKFLQNTQEKVLQFLEIVALETTKVHGGLEFFKFKRIQRKFEIRSQRFFKIVVLKNFAKFAGKHLCQSLFFNKVAGLRR